MKMRTYLFVAIGFLVVCITVYQFFIISLFKEKGPSIVIVPQQSSLQVVVKGTYPRAMQPRLVLLVSGERKPVLQDDWLATYDDILAKLREEQSFVLASERFNSRYLDHAIFNIAIGTKPRERWGNKIYLMLFDSSVIDDKYLSFRWIGEFKVAQH